MVAFSTGVVCAQVTKAFPDHWGKPPAIQTRDHVELPDGFGHGSSTLAKWIAANLAKDQSTAAGKATSQPAPLYENDFEKAEVGKFPEELKFPTGEFAVGEEGGNKFLELPGAPLDSFSVQFGPTETSGVSVSARIYGTARGRRYPTFGVGLNGVGGYRLQISPGKKALELYKDLDVKASIACEWKPGKWLCFRCQIRKLSDASWKIEGKVWSADGVEPKDWMIHFDEPEEPVPGRASIVGSPFAGTPIYYDDLKVEKAQSK